MTQILHSPQCVFSSNLYSEILLKLRSFCTLAVKRAVRVLLWVTYIHTYLFIHTVLFLFKSKCTCVIAAVGFFSSPWMLRWVLVIWYPQPQWHMCKYKENPWRSLNIETSIRFHGRNKNHSCEMLYDTEMLGKTSQVIMSNVIILLLRFRTCLHSQCLSGYNSSFVSSRLQHHCVHTCIADKHSF